MRSRTPVTLIVAGAMAAACVLLPTMAGAATAAPPEFIGWSGGTEVIALGGTVTSDLTAPSAINSPKTGVTSTNHVASAAVSGLANVGAVTTSETSTAIAGGSEIVSHAKTAGLSLLNGLITADAIDTTATAKQINGVASFTSQTTFVDLKIAGAHLPLTIPKNFGVTIPGVASVVLNAAYGVPGANGTIRADAAGLYLSLLKTRGDSPAGTEVYLNPSHAEIGVAAAPTANPVGGFAYGTRIDVAAAKAVGVNVGPTVYSTMPQAGTGGKDLQKSTAALKLPGLATAGAVYTVANGTDNATTADSSMTVELAGANLLGGLIKADALKATAHVKQVNGGKITFTETTSLVGLVIAGAKIPVNVAPNTVIKIGNIATVIINQQATTSTVSAVRLLDITLSTAGFGLPAGAEIEVGAAAAYVSHA